MGVKSVLEMKFKGADSLDIDLSVDNWVSKLDLNEINKVPLGKLDHTAKVKILESLMDKITQKVG